MQSLINVVEQLSKTYQKLESGEIELKLAAELNNGLGKITAANKAQTVYLALRCQYPNAPRIPFLEAGMVPQSSEAETVQ